MLFLFWGWLLRVGSKVSRRSGDVERVTGVVIDPRQRPDVDAAGQLAEGHIGLPGLVWQIGFEEHVGRLGSFFGSGLTRPAAKKCGANSIPR